MSKLSLTCVFFQKWKSKYEADENYVSGGLHMYVYAPQILQILLNVFCTLFINMRARAERDQFFCSCGFTFSPRSLPPLQNNQLKVN